jgi:hypothetical protein
MIVVPGHSRRMEDDRRRFAGRCPTDASAGSGPTGPANMTPAAINTYIDRFAIMANSYSRSRDVTGADQCHMTGQQFPSSTAQDG